VEVSVVAFWYHVRGRRNQLLLTVMNGMAPRDELMTVGEYYLLHIHFQYVHNANRSEP
jgi:hypothetical protein